MPLFKGHRGTAVLLGTVCLFRPGSLRHAFSSIFHMNCDTALRRELKKAYGQLVKRQANASVPMPADSKPVTWDESSQKTLHRAIERAWRSVAARRR